MAKLKQQDGQDLVMYGHGPLGETLLAHNLLDELQFAIHPLLETRTLRTGVVILSYRPVAA